VEAPAMPDALQEDSNPELVATTPVVPNAFVVINGKATPHRQTPAQPETGTFPLILSTLNYESLKC